ncbi:histidine kinase hhk13p [Seiridium cupressi]
MTTTDEVSLLDELKSPEPANGQSDTIEHTNHNSPPGDVSLGAVYPQGYLGDLEHLEWLRQFDWTSSSCGPIETWPDELRQACIYANLTFAPLLAKNRSVVGIWVATHETTRQVLSEKRIRILTDLGNDLAHLTALPDLWTSLVNMLERCKNDFEFAAVYGTDSLLDKSTKIALHAVMGMSESGDRHPDLDAAIRTALTTGAATWLSTASNNLSEGLAEYFRTHGVQGACREYILQPVRCNIDDDIVAVILVGIYPFREYDHDLQSFMQLLTRQVESSTTVIRNLEKEKARLEHEFITKMDKMFWNSAEKAPIGIYTYDQEGSMTYCNKAFEDLVGAPRAALSRPMGWTGVVHPDSLEHINSIWEKLVEKQEYPATFDVQFTKAWAPRGKDQFLDRTWCLANSYPEITDQGEVKGVIGCAMDVSSLKWAESIQSERLSEALELKRQQGTFFDVMSHELRNPLDSKLIQIFPISTNPAKLLKEVVAIFSAELRNSGIGLEIKLGAGYRMLDIDAVMIDPHRVTQVIVNLLSNAIKFIKDEPQRNISLSVDAFMTDQEQDPRVRYVSSGTYHRDPTSDVEWGVGTPFYLSFSVQDTGLGMTEEESNRLFKQFSQASPRTHAQYGGSGLGLFISRELTELHGGRIGLWSERGAGSLFSFYVKARLDITRQTIGSPIIKAASYPRIQELNLSTPTLEDPTKGSLISSQELPNTREPSASSATGASIKRVLLVEDNIINQRLLKKLLIKHNYDVTVANNGQEALEMVQGSKWHTTLQSADRPQLDIVLSDIEMPIMDGKACIRRIRQLQREGMLQQDIPVLAVTGNAQREKVQEFQDCGFDAVITKPYDIPKLLRIIHEYSTKYDSLS